MHSNQVNWLGISNHLKIKSWYSGWNVQLYHNNVYGLWFNRLSFNGSWVILYHSITHASMGNGLSVMVYHSWCNVHGSSLMVQSFIIEIRSFDWLKIKFVSQPVFRNISLKSKRLHKIRFSYLRTARPEYIILKIMRMSTNLIWYKMKLYWKNNLCVRVCVC